MKHFIDLTEDEQKPYKELAISLLRYLYTINGLEASIDEDIVTAAAIDIYVFTIDKINEITQKMRRKIIIYEDAFENLELIKKGTNS